MPGRRAWRRGAAPTVAESRGSCVALLCEELQGGLRRLWLGLMLWPPVVTLLACEPCGAMACGTAGRPFDGRTSDLLELECSLLVLECEGSFLLELERNMAGQLIWRKLHGRVGGSVELLTSSTAGIPCGMTEWNDVSK